MEGAALAALVDEHGGALYRFARLVGRRPRADVAATVGRAWSEAAPRLDDRPAGITVRGWLLLFIVRQLDGASSQAIGGELAGGPASEVEGPGGRWGGWGEDGVGPAPRAGDPPPGRAVPAGAGRAGPP